MAIAELELTRAIKPEQNRFGPVEAPLKTPVVEWRAEESPAQRQAAIDRAKHDVDLGFEKAADAPESKVPEIFALNQSISSAETEHARATLKNLAQDRVGEAPLMAGVEALRDLVRPDLKLFALWSKAGTKSGRERQYFDPQNLLGRWQNKVEQFLKHYAATPDVASAFWGKYSKIVEDWQRQMPRGSAENLRLTTLTSFGLERYYSEVLKRLVRCVTAQERLWGIDFFVKSQGHPGFKDGFEPHHVIVPIDQRNNDTRRMVTGVIATTSASVAEWPGLSKYCEEKGVPQGAGVYHEIPTLPETVSEEGVFKPEVIDFLNSIKR